CQSDEPASTDILSNEASLLALEFVVEGKAYFPTIENLNLSFAEPLPYGTEELLLVSLQLAPGASCDLQAGDRIAVEESPQRIEVVSEDQRVRREYVLTIEVETEPNYEALLFGPTSVSSCEVFANLEIGAFKVENNVWNAGGLAAGSYTQCIYSYEKEDLSFWGWEWAYPNDAYGVNAYPQIIYGWKPWIASSTTPKLPLKVGDINRLKVSYAVDVSRNNGSYNLAFDNWINSSSSINPQNIQFEFMIWEDAHNLDPFGEFQGAVTTSNGVYHLYQGEPDWEPPGSNWTYLAFVRQGNRQAGTVDIDELLTYLVEQGIVSAESYLASIEFGNEVGNSTGRTIVQEFVVELE
ncbi:MAG: hypothetical protein AAFU60_13135, partial [Bacteroidota bacterium]